MSQYTLVLDRYPELDYHAELPRLDDPGELRLQRKWEAAVGYRIFAALRWGQLGDGHISARDPVRTDHFWVLAHGVPFSAATVDTLCLVGPDGRVVDGPTAGGINTAAYNIHWPVLQARPDLASAAHTHTQFGTPWSATARPFRPISQESCVFVFDQAVYDGEDLEVATLDGGRAIAEAMGDATVCILRNHGLLTGGRSPGAAVGSFVMAERVAEVHIKVADPSPISEEAAKDVAASLCVGDVGWKVFQWLARDLASNTYRCWTPGPRPERRAWLTIEYAGPSAGRDVPTAGRCQAAAAGWSLRRPVGALSESSHRRPRHRGSRIYET